MSPGYFNIYINDVIDKLRMNGLYILPRGRYIYCGCLLFADILLLSASVAQLQLMLNICSELAVITGLNFSHILQIFKYLSE